METVPIFNAIDSTGTVDAVLIGGDDHIDFRMPRVRGDVVTADYTMEVERRAWFFQQDLYGTGGVTGGEVLLMPLPAASLDQTIVDIAPFDSSKWLSARIYDQGECSVLAEWTVANPVFGLPDMVTVISSAVDSAFISSPNVVGGRRTVTMAITPVFRSRRIIDGASVTDSIRVTSAYFADRIMEAGGGSGAVNSEVFARRPDARRPSRGPAREDRVEQARSGVGAAGYGESGSDLDPDREAAISARCSVAWRERATAVA